MTLTEVLTLASAGFSKEDIVNMRKNVSGNTLLEQSQNNVSDVRDNENVARTPFDYKQFAKAVIEAQQEYNRSTDCSKNVSQADIGSLF